MKKVQQNLWIVCALLVAMSFMLGCGGNDSDSGGEDIIAPSTNTQTTTPASSGADPSVSAEDGGNGFEAIAAEQGWETNTDYVSEGDPNAKKGGSFSMALTEYPATFRILGKNSNYQVTRRMNDLIYEGLLNYDPIESRYFPLLASHWKVSEDKRTFQFRINPAARWSDGRPVTAEDVVATYKLNVDKGIEDPFTNALYSEYYEMPTATSKYIVEVKTKKDNWRAFLYFSASMQILPAYHLNKIDGATYLKEYQYKMLPGTGPYILDEDKTKKGEVAVIKRRTDFWQEGNQYVKGLYNFDEIRIPIVRENRLRFEKFKKGEFDYFIIGTSSTEWWAEDLTPEQNDDVKRGLLQKRKIYNYKPGGLTGLAMNATKPPFDDIKIRQAIQHLFNVDQINEKMLFGEYGVCGSYFPNGIYANPNNKATPYDPQATLKLLGEAGWAKKSGEQWLTNKAGKSFELDLLVDKRINKYLVPFQQDAKNIGIKINFDSMDGNESFKRMQAKDYTIAYMGWGGLFFPNPEPSMHSRYAKEKENTNITGMSHPRIDEICALYDKSYDGAERIRLLQEIDSIAMAQRHYAMGWLPDYTRRVVFWNKFEMPKSGFTYAGDFEGAFSLWWVDAEKEKTLEQARKDGKTTMPVGEMIIDKWNKRSGKDARAAVNTAP